MKPFGRNQIIGAVGYGVPMLLTFALVLGGKVTGAEWISFSEVYVPIAVGSMLGIAGAVKAVSAGRGGGAGA